MFSRILDSLEVKMNLKHPIILVNPSGYILSSLLVFKLRRCNTAATSAAASVSAARFYYVCIYDVVTLTNYCKLA